MNFREVGDEIKVYLNNGTEISFAISNGRVKGICNVTSSGKLLRSKEECIFPEIATPDGIEIDRYELVGVEQRNEELVIKTKPYFRVGHRMEWQEHATHLRVNTSSWTREPFSPEDSIMEWKIKEESERFDGVLYQGFSYGFYYRGPGYPIYQIEDKATWELGGTAVGNTFVMRGGSFPGFAELDQDTGYFTGWEMPGIANPYVFQHMPLYAGLSGFTFQYDTQNILLTVHEKPSHVRSIFMKEPGDHKLLHFNQFCFNLTEEVTTPARKILTAVRKDNNKAGIINHYLRVKETIHQRLWDYYNIKLDPARPSSHVETWDIAKTENFKPIFEQLDEWGIKRAFLMPLWRSNETEINPRLKDIKEKLNFTGNMCCPLELEIADCYGGWNGLEEILSRAVELGIDTYMWFGSHFSSFSPLEGKIKDIFAKDFNGQNNRNNYGHVLFAVNQNSRDYQEYLINAFRRAKGCGLTGVFRDSHFNMAVDTINYLHVPYEKQQAGVTMDQIGFLKKGNKTDQDIVTTMHDAEITIQSRFQNELGMIYYVESGGAIGTPMCGTDYEVIRGCEFLFSDMETGLNFDKVKEFGDDINMVYFKGLSVRLIYQIHVEVNKFPAHDAIDEWWNPETMVPMTKAFYKVEDFMKTMWVMEDDRGILWEDGIHQVIFAYKDFHYAVEAGKTVYDVMGDQMIKADGCALLNQMKIYLIK